MFSVENSKIENTKKKFLPSVTQLHINTADFLPCPLLFHFRLCFEGQQKHPREEGGGGGKSILEEQWKPVYPPPETTSYVRPEISVSVFRPGILVLVYIQSLVRVTASLGLSCLLCKMEIFSFSSHLAALHAPDADKHTPVTESVITWNPG